MSQAGQPRDRIRRNMRGGARFGGSASYATIGADGAITQVGSGTGTWLGTHAFAAATFSSTVDIDGAASVGGTACLTGAVHAYSTMDVDGAASVGGTLLVDGVTTINAAPVLAGNGRPTHSLFIDAARWTDTASTAETVLNSKWNTIYFTPAASETDVTIYANAQVPRDMDVGATGGFTASYVVWSLGALAASAVADWRLTLDSVATNEAAGTASTVEIAKGASLTSATANRIWQSDLGAIGAAAGFADGDYLSLALQLCGSSTYTSGGCPYFIGLRLDYLADTL